MMGVYGKMALVVNSGAVAWMRNVQRWFEHIPEVDEGRLIKNMLTIEILGTYEGGKPFHCVEKLIEQYEREMESL